MRDSDVQKTIDRLTENLNDAKDLQWFAVRGHWVIRKVPNTKDQFYVAIGHPPADVLRIYGIN